MDQHQGNRFLFDRAGIYEIHVFGTLTTAMSNVLAGMTTNQLSRSDNAEMNATVVTAWLPDQAALNGVLNTLYDHGYTLALVRQVEYSVSNEST